MNAGRAETYLRLVIEAELRRVSAQVRDAGPLDLPPYSASTVAQVARALTVIGALEVATADSIGEDYELAVAVRRPGRGSAHTPLQRWRQTRRRPGLAAAERGAADRVVPVGATIPLADGQVRGTLRVLSYAQTPSTAWLTVVATNRGGAPPFNGLTATDEAGTRYQLHFSGGGIREWAGQLTLVPAPPPAIRWLDLIPVPGGPAWRVELTAGQQPDVVLAPAAFSLGEHLLNGMAARLLASVPDDWAEREPFGVPVPLGAIVGALQAAGALSATSPVPGRLVTLCESLNLRDHGIAATPVSDLPEPWLSLLAHYNRRKPCLAATPDGSAAVALKLPPVDGVQVCLLGVCNTEGETVLDIYASGVDPRASYGDDAAVLPALWLRGAAGRWHATGTARPSGNPALRVEVKPPLGRPAEVDLLATGRSAQARATVPLRWV